MAKRKTKKPNVKTGCLLCGKDSFLNRGLCPTHHARYYKEARKLTAEQKKLYDETLVERGLLLPKKKPGPKISDNRFGDVASELFDGDGKRDGD